MSFFKKTKSSLGVDVGAAGIKLVELRLNKGRPQLITYAMADQALDVHGLAGEKSVADLVHEKAPGQIVNHAISLSEDPRVSVYAGLLRQALKQARVVSEQAVASLPVSSVFHTVMTLPPVDKKELAHHVEAKVKKMLPRPIEEMQVVHQVIPQAVPAGQKPDENIRVLVTAAPKDVVRFYTAIFERAGLALQELETEAFALERSLVGRDSATAMIVDVGAERTNFFIIDNRLPLTHRSIQVGGRDINRLLAEQWGVTVLEAERMKHELAYLGRRDMPGETFASFLDPIIKEIEYSIDVFAHQSGSPDKRPEKIILTGGDAVFPLIQQAISAAFPIKVFVGDPWARVVCQQSLRPILNMYGPRMGVCIGLALRNLVD